MIQLHQALFSWRAAALFSMAVIFWWVAFPIAYRLTVSPAVYMDVRSVYVADAPVGGDPSVTIDRDINRNFTGRNEATVRIMEPDGTIWDYCRPGIRDEYKSGRVAALFASLGSEPAECAVTLDRDGRAHAAVTLPRRRYSDAELAALTGEVSRICHRPMDVPEKLSCKEATTLIFCEKPTMRPVFGTAGCAAKGEVSGDAVQQFCTGDCAVSILCDGMGTGCPAAVDGNLAATLTARLLRAGFEPETAARLINVALSLKSEEESGATLDLIRIDLFTGATELFKAGGAPGFVVQAGRARKIEGPGLPMGILSGVNAQMRHIHLETGDFAVLVSDGMLVDGPDWILQQLELSAKSGQTAQQLAQLLVKTARSRAERTGRPDDITAAVVALEKSV